MAVTLGSACSISQVWGEQGAQAVSRVGCYKRVLARKELSDTSPLSIYLGSLVNESPLPRMEKCVEAACCSQSVMTQKQLEEPAGSHGQPEKISERTGETGRVSIIPGNLIKDRKMVINSPAIQ